MKPPGRCAAINAPHRADHDDDGREAGAEPADAAMQVDAPVGDERRCTTSRSIHAVKHAPCT